MTCSYHVEPGLTFILYSTHRRKQHVVLDMISQVKSDLSPISYTTFPFHLKPHLEFFFRTQQSSANGVVLCTIITSWAWPHPHSTNNISFQVDSDLALLTFFCYVESDFILFRTRHSSASDMSFGIHYRSCRNSTQSCTRWHVGSNTPKHCTRPLVEPDPRLNLISTITISSGIQNE